MVRPREPGVAGRILGALRPRATLVLWEHDAGSAGLLAEMANVTLDLIVIGVAIALDPLPLTTFIIVLSSVGGVRKGSAFVFGWLVSMAVVVAVTILATGNNPPKPNTAPSIAALAVRIVIGAGLVVIAVRQRRRMGRPKREKKVPRWQAGVDAMSPWYALALAPVVQPWGLIAAGVATVTQAKVSSAADVLVLILFCVLGTSTYLALEIYAGFWPDRAASTLAAIRNWIDTHTDQAIIIGSLAVGFWLMGKSAYLLVAGS